MQPLKKLAGAVEGDDRNSPLLATAKKFTILTVTATCTSALLLLVVAVSGMTPFTVVDMVINSLVLVMFSKHGHWLYLKLCCFCDRPPAHLEVMSVETDDNSQDKTTASL